MFFFARRPENRRRADVPESERRPWAETEPQCFRSEAFAEDLLPGHGEPLLAPPPVQFPRLQQA